MNRGAEAINKLKLTEIMPVAFFLKMKAAKENGKFNSIVQTLGQGLT